jgi:hypothetical protein
MSAAFGPQSAVSRYELKYWLPEIAASRAIAFARPFLNLDPLSQPTQGNAERVTSLYLDSREREFYVQHVASAADRFKLRIRYYGESPGATAYFEIKRKVGMVIDKRRAEVPTPEVQQAVTLGRCPTAAHNGHAPHLKSFLSLMTLHRALPQVLITCLRESYVPRDPREKIRVTVDREVAFQPTASPSLAGRPGCWHTTPTVRRGALLELKFSGTMPWWMRELSLRVGRYRTAYSKYVSATAIVTGDCDPCIESLGAFA